MPIQRNFLEYHKSIARELDATKDRIRQLIGNKHWLTDGEHKEAVLRRVLRARLPESVRVGRGFVCFREEKTSNQIDILITAHDKPTLFRDGELALVTPDAVRAIVEVKTCLRNTSSPKDKLSLKKVIKKLSENIGEIRESGNVECQAGLFIYEPSCRKKQISDQIILKELWSATEGRRTKAINWLAFGPDRFFRYWENGFEVMSRCEGSTWHSYLLENGLGHAYFLSNVVWEMSSPNKQDIQEFYFPVQGGKELFRRWCISLENGQLRELDRLMPYRPPVPELRRRT